MVALRIDFWKLFNFYLTAYGFYFFSFWNDYIKDECLEPIRTGGNCKYRRQMMILQLLAKTITDNDRYDDYTKRY